MDQPAFDKKNDLWVNDEETTVWFEKNQKEISRLFLALFSKKEIQIVKKKIKVFYNKWTMLL